jgi:hypothetical protein
MQPLTAPSSTDARTQLAILEAEIKRREWARDPALWSKERLNRELWSAQVRIMESVRDNRHVAVRSSFATGKSFVAATLAAWWLDVHPPGEAFVVTTATTEAQVKAILWHEIAIAHAAGKLPGRLNQTEWWMNVGGIDQIVGFGRKPADTNATAFHGIHRKYVLVIIDEGSGVAGAIWDAAEGLAANEYSRILVIGNPEDPLSMFAEVSKPGSGWVAFKISAFDTPAFTGEKVSQKILDLLVSRIWVEERAKRWGTDNPKYISKVLGEFPEVSDNCLILPGWVLAAQERTLQPTRPNELGVDVGAGGDKTVIAHRRGGVVRIVKRERQPDTMKACGNVIDAIRKYGAELAKVDEIGVGKGVVDRAKEQKYNVIGVNVGKAPDRTLKRKGKREVDEHDDAEQFLNRRAQGYWHLRELFLMGEIDIDPHDEELAAQLVDIQYERLSNGTIKIESKEEMKRRKKAKGADGESPDEADAVMLAFMPAQSLKTVSAVWGSGGRRRR